MRPFFGGRICGYPPVKGKFDANAVLRVLLIAPYCKSGSLRLFFPRCGLCRGRQSCGTGGGSLSYGIGNIGHDIPEKGVVCGGALNKREFGAGILVAAGIAVSQVSKICRERKEKEEI